MRRSSQVGGGGGGDSGLRGARVGAGFERAIGQLLFVGKWPQVYQPAAIYHILTHILTGNTAQAQGQPFGIPIHVEDTCPHPLAAPHHVSGMQKGSFG